MRLAALFGAVISAAAVALLVLAHLRITDGQRPLTRPKRGSSTGANRLRGAEPSRRPTAAPTHAPQRRGRTAGAGPRRATRAHTIVISNENYVDGALAMGWSLAKYSSADPTVDLVCLATRGRIGEASRARLAKAGWDQVREVPGLAKHVPKSFYKDTFDKLHVFNLTEYSRVVYWDADMLVTNDPKGIFSIRLPSVRHVAAIGASPVGSYTYFQTGMMLIAPTQELFAALWTLFAHGSAPLNVSGEFNRWRARDGTMLRGFFGSNYTMLPEQYSVHLGAGVAVGQTIGVHYRGGFKPWMDRAKALTGPQAAQSSKSFGYPYQAWWGVYEEYHSSVCGDEHWEHVPVGVSPRTHVWMMRGVKGGYVQLLSSVSAHRRAVYRPGRVVVGRPGVSCDVACAGQCDESALRWSGFDSCGALQTEAGLTCAGKCKLGVYTKTSTSDWLPAVEQGTNRCAVSQWEVDSRVQVSCGAAADGWSRVCPCGGGDELPPLSLSDWLRHDALAE